MQKNIRVKSICALAGVALTLGATGSANASSLEPLASADATAKARLQVEAGVAVPVSVSSASVGVRETKVGKVEQPGKVITTPAIAAGTKVKVIAALHASADAGATVAISSSNVKDSVDVTYDKAKKCFGIGVNYIADVAVSAAATSSTGSVAQTWGSFAVMVGDTKIFGWDSAKVTLNSAAAIKDFHREAIPVKTGADVCLPDADIDPEAAVKVVADAAAGVKVTG